MLAFRQDSYSRRGAAKSQGQRGGAAGDDEAVRMEAGLALEDADARRQVGLELGVPLEQHPFRWNRVQVESRSAITERIKLL